MFSHIQAYKDKLIPFMLTINENINWNDVLNKIMSMSEDKQLSRIRSFLWTDKDINDEDERIENEYVRYASLIVRNYEQMKTGDLVVVGEPADELSNQSEALNNIARLRFHALTNFLKFKLIKFRVVNSLDGLNDCVVIPTCSIMYKQADLSGLNIIRDDLHNLYVDEIDKEFCLFKLCVLTLFVDVDVDISQCLKLDFGLHKVRVVD